MAKEVVSKTNIFELLGALLGFALLKYLPALPIPALAKYSQIIYGILVIILGKILTHDGVKRMLYVAGMVEIAGNIFALI
jgi:hypothetical protein